VGIATFDGAKSATDRDRKRVGEKDREKETEREKERKREREKERQRERERTSCCVRMLLGTCCGKLCGGSFPVARATGSLFLLPHIYIYIYILYIASWPLLPCALIELEPRIHSLCAS